MTWEFVMSFRLQDYKFNPLTSHSISSTTLYRETIFKVASFSYSTLVVVCSPTCMVTHTLREEMRLGTRLHGKMLQLQTCFQPYNHWWTGIKNHFYTL